MSKKNLTGQKVAITGGARGIGRATAEAFIAAGTSVAIGDIDADLAEKTAAEISEATGGKVVGLALDVTDSTSFAAFIDNAAKELGGLDVLVNNAGIMPTGAFTEESETVTDRQIDINIRGVITGSKLAATRFIAQGSGHIVNVASLAGIVPSPGVAVYCATKAAVVALGDALDQELPPQGVQVTTIAPSLTRTELISGVATNRLADLVTVDPEDVANTIVRKVASGRGGLAPVPGVPGRVFRTTTVLPTVIRNPLYKALGLTPTSTTTSRHAGRISPGSRVRPSDRPRTRKKPPHDCIHGPGCTGVDAFARSGALRGGAGHLRVGTRDLRHARRRLRAPQVQRG